MDFSGSFIISDGLTSFITPRPLHSGQAPKGLLNEKSLGSISDMLIPHVGQANFSENICVSQLFFVLTLISIIPSASSNACSIESDILGLSLSSTVSWSIITDIECFSVFLIVS